MTISKDGNIHTWNEHEDIILNCLQYLVYVHETKKMSPKTHRQISPFIASRESSFKTTSSPFGKLILLRLHRPRLPTGWSCNLQSTYPIDNCLNMGGHFLLFESFVFRARFMIKYEQQTVTQSEPYQTSKIELLTKTLNG